MDGDDSAGEDEGASLQRRFSREGLEWGAVEGGERALHVWRWLVDAEANLRAARHINDKLRRQHDEEKTELEEYSEHLRQRCEGRVRELEEEVKALKDDLEALLAGTQAVSAMLEAEGLHDVAQTSLGEQIAYILVERKKLVEELASARTSPATDREKDLTTQLIKACTELEVLRQTHKATQTQLGGLQERLSLLERASRQLEADNETLAFKLSEALGEIEDREGQLRRLSKSHHFRRGESPRASVRSLEEALIHGTPGTQSLRGQRDTAPAPPLALSLHRRESGRSSGRRRRTSGNSRRGSVGGDGSPTHKYPSLPDPPQHPHTHPHASPQPPSASTLQENKKLQEEVEQVRRSLLEVGDRCEAAIVKYELYKIKSKGKIHALKSGHASELEAVRREVNKLEAEVALRGDQLRAEDTLRKRLEEDLDKLRLERQELAARVRESERATQEHTQQVALLQERVNLLKEENDQLGERLQDLSVTAIVG
ncbi:nuclear mitotic apparatus protein 1-like [Eriocheir sinensis]|uniref:nuclear mitotic apparatus protein 1-like n=1 Tax=Eriocheir sinensis TaxID=95602 RepID=UPI0021CA30D0|nr:nuclear mitotic apparatus protein 1-like [Eriocheir sinensis]XP_050696923.1 nuclear mitotic apparatus protein 1-like [Eriocheir sinensis]